MDVLLWLAPAAIVTVAAMVWATRQGSRQETPADREEAVRRLGAALQTDFKPEYHALEAPARNQSGAVTIRRHAS